MIMIEHLIMADLIFMSRGASTAKEGERLTLINVNGCLLLLGVEVKADLVNSTSKNLKIFISHLNQPGFEVGVDKNIKSIELKTIVPGGR